MYEVSDKFIEHSRQHGRRVTARVTWDDVVLEGDDVFKITKQFKSDLFFSAMQTVEGELLGRHNLTEKEVNIEIGIHFNDMPVEYIDYGIFVVTEHERIVGSKGESDKTTFVSSDKMIKAHTNYDVNELNITFPITVGNLFNSISNYMGLIPKVENVANIDMEIEEDKWTNIENVTYRNVLDDLAATMGCVVIVRNNNLLARGIDITVNPNANMSIEENSMRSLKMSEQFGPVNIVNLTRELSHNNYPFPLDWHTLPESQRKEIVIPDNQIMDKRREEYAPDLYNQVGGLNYYPFESDAYGATHFEPADIIKVIDLEGNEFISLITSSILEFTSGIKEVIKSEVPLFSKEKYALASDSRREMMRVYLLVDQQEGKITAAVEKADEAYDKSVELGLTVDELTGIVSSLNVGVNLIYNLNGEGDYEGWTFERDALYPSTDLYPSSDIYPTSSKSPIFEIKDSHSLSGKELHFNTQGKAFSNLAYIVPTQVYSYRARRMQGNQSYKVAIIQYDQGLREIKKVYYTLVGNLYEAITFTPETNTMWARLEIETQDDNLLVLTDQMFNRGNPSDYNESAKDVKVWAESMFKLTSEDIELVNQKANSVEGRIDNTTVRISSDEGVEVWATNGKGLTIYGPDNARNLFINTMGDLIMNGKLTAGTVGDFIVSDTLKSVDGILELNPKDSVITINDTNFEAVNYVQEGYPSTSGIRVKSKQTRTLFNIQSNGPSFFNVVDSQGKGLSVTANGDKTHMLLSGWFKTDEVDTKVVNSTNITVTKKLKVGSNDAESGIEVYGDLSASRINSMLATVSGLTTVGSLNSKGNVTVDTRLTTSELVVTGQTTLKNVLVSSMTASSITSTSGTVGSVRMNGNRVIANYLQADIRVEAKSLSFDGRIVYVDGSGYLKVM